MHGGVGLDHHQLRHAHAVDLADASEVVAQQVDDHQVLGEGLFVVQQLRAQRLVARRVRRARRRPLDRARLHATLAVDREEALRRGADARRARRASGRRRTAPGCCGAARDRARTAPGSRRWRSGRSGRPRRTRRRQARPGSGRCRRGTARARARRRNVTGSTGGSSAARRARERLRGGGCSSDLAHDRLGLRRASARPPAHRPRQSASRWVRWRRGRRRRRGWRASAPRRERRSGGRWASRSRPCTHSRGSRRSRRAGRRGSSARRLDRARRHLAVEHVEDRAVLDRRRLRAVDA